MCVLFLKAKSLKAFLMDCSVFSFHEYVDLSVSIFFLCVCLSLSAGWLPILRSFHIRHTHLTSILLGPDTPSSCLAPSPEGWWLLLAKVKALLSFLWPWFSQEFKTIYPATTCGASYTTTAAFSTRMASWGSPAAPMRSSRR